MKINIKDLDEKIEKQDYIQDLETVKYADISRSKSKIRPHAEKMVKEVVMAFKKNSLVQTQLAVTGQRPVTFGLETNVINLPYTNYKRIANFFEEGQDYGLNVYFETSSEYVNVSHFRIDQLATEAEIENDPAGITEKLVDAMVAKLKVIRKYKKPVKAKTTVTRRSTKKTRRKRTTRRRKTTKK